MQIAGYPGLSLAEALRYWKAKFETIKHFKRDVITHESLGKLYEFVEDVWEDIQPITVGEALKEPHIEKRRVMFDCIGVAKLFQELKPELLDKKVIHKSRTRWNKQNESYLYSFDDTYELYKLDAEKLFESTPSWGWLQPVFAVRCWCTTTNREYWIYVPEIAVYGRISWPNRQSYPEKPDAVRAIAWTIRINISEPKRIYRQGDIVVAEESETSREVEPYHLTKAQYLSLMYSET